MLVNHMKFYCYYVYRKSFYTNVIIKLFETTCKFLITKNLFISHVLQISIKFLKIIFELLLIFLALFLENKTINK